MGKPDRPDRDVEGVILEGMARALWVHAYMSWTLEVEAPPDLGSRTWEEIAPNNSSTWKASMSAAKDLAATLGKVNSLGRHPLAAIYHRAVGWIAAGNALHPYTVLYDTDSVLYALGEDIAHVCMGTREPEDSPFPFTHNLVIPHFRAELTDDGDEMVWEVHADGQRSGFPEGPHHRVKNPCQCRNPSDVKQILVIEDDPQLQRAYPRMMRKMYPGSEVTVVNSYGDAVGHLEAQPVDLVVSDVDLVGDRTGIDVFEWVKTHKPHLVDRYVFVTGGNPQVAQLHYRYAEKPATIPELQAAIDRPAPLHPNPGKLTAKRAKDFATSGNYEVRDESGTVVALLFRDPGNREWYEESMPGARQTHYTERWLGATQAEAIERLTSRTEREMTFNPPPPPGAPRRPAKRAPRRADQDDEDNDDDPKELSAADHRALDEMQYGTPGTTRVTPLIAQQLIAMRKEMVPIMSAEGGQRLAMRIDRALASGLLDTQLESSLEEDEYYRRTYGSNPPTTKVTAAGVRKLVKGALSESEAARVADCINDVLRSEAVPPVRAAPREMDLPAFAAAVHAVLPDIQPDPDADDRARERFGTTKVFIAAIWRRLSADPRFAGMTEAQFKRRLLEAQRARLLDMARADLVGAMNHREVMASQIGSRQEGFEFHFVIDPEASRRQGW